VTDIEQRIQRIEEFKQKLLEWSKFRGDRNAEEWLNLNRRWVEREVIEAGCARTLTMDPAPGIASGLIVRNVNPFDHMQYHNMVAVICEILDQTVEVLREKPPPEIQRPATPTRAVQQEVRLPPTPDTDNQEEQPMPTPDIVDQQVQNAYAFIAMPMGNGDHALVDVLETIKTAAGDCGIIAERIDDDESSDRITDRMLESIRRAEYVIADLTHERPNVFWEPGTLMV
jgi:hypothetical protein